LNSNYFKTYTKYDNLHRNAFNMFIDLASLKHTKRITYNTRESPVSRDRKRILNKVG